MGPNRGLAKDAVRKGGEGRKEATSEREQDKREAGVTGGMQKARRKEKTGTRRGEKEISKRRRRAAAGPKGDETEVRSDGGLGGSYFLSV